MGNLHIQRYHNGQVLAIHGYLDSEHCKALINQAEEIGFAEATVSIGGGEKMIKSVRNNYRATMQDANLANEQFQRSQIFLPEYIDDWRVEGLSPRFRFYKYEPGQRFKKHQDGRQQLGENLESRYTWMVYLNDNFQGGALAFENGEAIQPETGLLVLFPHETKHESLPVAAGEKYVLRNDVAYRQLPQLTDDYTSDATRHDFNELFCDKVSQVFDGFFQRLGYEVVQREREAWSAIYKYKHYGHNLSVAFKYSGYPDGPAYYEILIKLPNRTVGLEWLCGMLHPEYQPNQDQYVTLIRNDYRQLLDKDFELRLIRHLWEMKLLCNELLLGNISTL